MFETITFDVTYIHILLRRHGISYLTEFQAQTLIKFQWRASSQTIGSTFFHYLIIRGFYHATYFIQQKFPSVPWKNREFEREPYARLSLLIKVVSLQ